MIDRRVLLLATGCAFFAAFILLEISAQTMRPTPLSASPQKTDVPPAPTSDIVSDPHQLVPAILARPLFSSTRRPAQAIDASSNFELGGARLTGIIIAPNKRVAIFEIKGSKPLVLNEGETVSGWRVDRIAPGEVSLVGPAGSKTLQPKPDASHTAANVSAPAAPAPVNSRSRGPGQEPQR